MKSASARRRLGCLMTTSTPSERHHSNSCNASCSKRPSDSCALMFDRDIETEVFLLRGCFPQLEIEYNISRRTLEVRSYLCTSLGLFHSSFSQVVVPRVMRVSLDVCATTSASRPFVIEQVRVGPVGAQHTTHALLFAELTSVMRSAVVHFSTTHPASTLPSFLVCYYDCSCLFVLVAHIADL
jgi:hypothetical protein